MKLRGTKLCLGLVTAVYICSIPITSHAISKLDRALLFPFHDETSCTSSPTTTSSTLPATVPEPHNSLFTQAAATFTTNPQLIAALFLSEHANAWLPFDSPWASSPKGASGPFQFMPGTWSAYKADGDNDGVKDIQNIHDSAYAAANLTSANGITPNTPLGDINRPFAPGTILYAAAAYNWGGGNVQQNTTPDSPLNAPSVPVETQNYLSNVYNLISSGFTKGGGSLPDPQASNGSTAGSTPTSSTCAGSVSGNTVQTAVNYAWPDYHAPNYLELKPSYATAVQAAQAAGKYVGGGANPGVDCGGFVTRVMQDSGLDPNYGGGGNTRSQQQYMRDHAELYEQIIPKSTADLQPGDIAINDGHTYMYVGTVAGFNSPVASASFSENNTSWRSPMAGKETPASPQFNWYRHK